MPPLTGRYFDGISARSHEVALSQTAEGWFELRGESLVRTFGRHQVRLQSRLGSMPRTLTFDDGAQLQVDHDANLDVWFSPGDRVQSWADRIERRWRWVLAATATVTLALVLLFTVGIPRLADAVAQRVPAVAEVALAHQVMAILDRTHFDPTSLPDARRAELAGGFATLVADLPRAADYRLEFRAAPSLGPNALALPGGIVVVTDELVALAQHDEEVLAVLAHEAGHHEGRHAMRAALQDSAVLLLVGFIAGDASSLGSLAVTIPAVLLQSGYSRGFEEAADAFAFELLRRRGISPRRFAAIMQRLAKEGPELDGVLGYVSTHPGSRARIEAAERSAGSD
jgi:Zn-dependent protease with chaperone function